MNTEYIKYVDLRNSLGIAATTLHDICKKENIEPKPITNSGHGKMISAKESRLVLSNRGYKYPDRAKIISYVMCKGGVGKTTSAYFTSVRMANYGAKILLIDADPQGNLTSSFNLEERINEETPVLTDIFSKNIKLTDVIMNISEHMDLLPSTPMNATLETVVRSTVKNPSKSLSRILNPILKNYDYIFIDCAPALNMTNTIMMLGSEELILPVIPDFYSRLGLKQTLEEIKILHNDFPEWKSKINILFTRYDAREYTSLKHLSDIAENHEEKLFRTTIRTSTSFKNAFDKRENIFYSKKSSAKEDYDALAKEIMNISSIIKTKTNQNAIQ